MPSAPAASKPSQGGIRLLRYVVFKSTLGPREGEEAKKIIYYYPEDEELDVQIQHVGLAEGCANFSQVFFPQHQPCKSLQTQKTRTVFFAAEDGYWLTLTVSVPFSKKTTKKGGECTEYRPDDVHDGVLYSILSHSYQIFRFFMGGFAFSWEVSDDEVDAFKARVSSFFSKYIPTIKPGFADIVDEFQAVQFLSLEAKSFLQVKAFVKKIEDEFPAVERVMFFQQGNVVWSDLQHDDTKLLYHYITTTLLPGHHPNAGSTSTPGPFTGHQGRFLVGGPPNPASHTFEEPKVPKVHLFRVRSEEEEGSGDHLEGRLEHHLVVYHAVSSTVCLMIPSFRELTHEFYSTLDASLGPYLTNMSADLMDVFGQNSSSAPMTSVDLGLSIRFVYFNRFNRAMKSTLNLPGSEDASSSPEVMNIMLDLAESIDLAKAGIPLEYFVKTTNDQWVIGKAADQRQVYVVITSKCANLMDASEAVERMFVNEFKNVVLQTLAVPGDFSVRKAISRTYVYRLAVSKNPRIEPEPTEHVSRRRLYSSRTVAYKKSSLSQLPFLTTLGVVEIFGKFDQAKFETAFGKFLGKHNFWRFTTALAVKNIIRDQGQDALEARLTKTVDSIEVRTLDMGNLKTLNPFVADYDFLEVEITSQGFLHNQIRRMVSCAVAYAKGSMALDTIQQMLVGVDHIQYGGKIGLMAPHGLHLVEVKYDPESLKGATENHKELPLKSPVFVSDICTPLDWYGITPCIVLYPTTTSFAPCPPL
eukprot:maker-scaffold911_size81771-snap-gene-0.21 protein:Tk03752 transcript:maker-scaffold911_size81771-snap-gene-0.21-mRNA-1 annotation:"vacuolar fusion protein ccz1 homolog"